MSISLFIIGIVLGGIATLVTLIFIVISLVGGKNKNAGIWAVAFVFSLIILILSIFQIAKRVGQKVSSGIEWMKDQKENGLSTADSATENYYVQERQYFLDTLNKYTNESLQAKMPADYYANIKAVRASDSSVILPFVYPFSIRYNSSTYLGSILSDVNDTVYLSNISQMAFDENFVIAKVENSGDTKLLKEGRGEIEYILFDLRTREYLSFVSQAQLLEKSGKIGYAGSQTMTYLSDLYRGWLDPLEPLNFDF
ncbi:MAG: hypothetical protein H0X46_01155 [Bacteroidetes bacterium]|nr:hypothetical protein [Bacteroidota bacterium]